MTSPTPVSPLPITIHAQYIKDLSFENPGAPQSLRGGPAPETSIDVNVQVKNVEDDSKTSLFEVILQFRIRATRTGKPFFLIDLDYAVVVSLDQVPDAARPLILLVDVTRLGFPFARQILADVTQNAGLPPLLLAPVDFSAFYDRWRAAQDPGALPLDK